jgi:hypothetical protein
MKCCSQNIFIAKGILDACVMKCFLIAGNQKDRRNKEGMEAYFCWKGGLA